MTFKRRIKLPLMPIILDECEEVSKEHRTVFSSLVVPNPYFAMSTKSTTSLLNLPWVYFFPAAVLSYFIFLMFWYLYDVYMALVIGIQNISNTHDNSIKPIPWWVFS